MPTYRTRRHLRAGTHTARAVTSAPRQIHIDPSPNWTINMVNEQAKSNQEFVRTFEDLCKRELAKDQSDSVRFKRSRLRQLLMLLAGSEAQADLFVDPKTGETRDPKAIYGVVSELVKPFRMDGGKWWASMKTWLRALRKTMYKMAGTRELITGVMDLALFVVISIMGKKTFDSAKNLQSTLNIIQNLYDNKSSKSIKPTRNDTIGVGAFVALLALFGSESATRVISNLARGNVFSLNTYVSMVRLLPNGIHTIIKGFYTLMTGAALEELYFVDGISKQKLAHMRRVAHTLQELDQAVERISDTDIAAHLETLRKRKSGRLWNNQMGIKLVKLLEDGMHPERYTLAKFRQKLMAVAPRVHTFYFFTSYGDARHTTRSIVAAYLIFEQRLNEARKDKVPELLPVIAHPKSLKDARVH